MSLSSDYLYGKDVVVPDIPDDVIFSRVSLLREHLSKLNRIPFAERTYDDIKQTNAVSKGIKFWNDLNGR